MIVLPQADSDLGTLISSLQIQSAAQIHRYSHQLCRGLAYMSSRDVWHRDIKPQNILYFSQSDTVVLGDFGLSEAVTCSKLTSEYFIAYTLWYRPPELLLGRKSRDTGGDVWALGCVLAEMILGRPLFPGDTLRDMLNKIFFTLGHPSASGYIVPNIQNYTYSHSSTLASDLFHARPDLDPLLVELITSMVAYPTVRITSSDLLNHPYFQTIPHDPYPEKCIRSLERREFYPRNPPSSDFLNRRLITFSWLRDVLRDIQAGNLDIARTPLYDRIYFLALYLYDLYQDKSRSPQYTGVACVYLASMYLFEIDIEPSFLLTWSSDKDARKIFWNIALDILATIRFDFGVALILDFLQEESVLIRILLFVISTTDLLFRFPAHILAQDSKISVISIMELTSSRPKLIL